MNKFEKRLFDLTIIFVSHIIFFPFWLFLWIGIPFFIWLEDGKGVFFKQRRIGKDGKMFYIYKFRSMVPKADRLGTAWTSEGDARITAIGKILRITALDELPQLFNIIRGEMSFVGPRPFDVDEHNLCVQKIPEFKERLSILPGLTSLAEVYDKEDDPKLTLHYDLEYIAKMSIWLDVKLILLSIRNTVNAKWDKRCGKAFHEAAK